MICIRCGDIYGLDDSGPFVLEGDLARSIGTVPGWNYADGLCAECFARQEHDNQPDLDECPF